MEPVTFLWPKHKSGVIAKSSTSGRLNLEQLNLKNNRIPPLLSTGGLGLLPIWPCDQALAAIPTSRCRGP